MNRFSFILGCLSTSMALTSCYKAPLENECCTMPITNNPVYTREKIGPVTVDDMVDAMIGEGIDYCVDKNK
jgi:hypothetical protein